LPPPTLSSRYIADRFLPREKRKAIDLIDEASGACAWRLTASPRTGPKWTPHHPAEIEREALKERNR